MSDMTMLITEMPSELKQWLSDEAARNGRSQSDEAICPLEEARAQREAATRPARNTICGYFSRARTSGTATLPMRWQSWATQCRRWAFRSQSPLADASHSSASAIMRLRTGSWGVSASSPSLRAEAKSIRAFHARICSTVMRGAWSSYAIVFHISISRSAVQMRGFLMPFASS